MKFFTLGYTIDIFLTFFERNRQSGTTSLIKKISEENDVFVIVQTEDEKEQFNGKALSINEINNKTFVGLKRKPILIDNHVIIELLKEVSSKLTHLEIQNERKENLLKRIKEDIEHAL